MSRAHITEFLFNDGDYFVAKTDMPGVRIGIVGGTIYDIPTGHAYFDRVTEATTRNEVEGYHDEFFAIYTA